MTGTDNHLGRNWTLVHLELSKAMWAADVGAVSRQVVVRVLCTNVEQGEQRPRRAPGGTAN